MWIRINIIEFVSPTLPTCCRLYVSDYKSQPQVATEFNLGFIYTAVAGAIWNVIQGFCSTTKISFICCISVIWFVNNCKTILSSKRATAFCKIWKTKFFENCLVERGKSFYIVSLVMGDSRLILSRDIVIRVFQRF